MPRALSLMLNFSERIDNFYTLIFQNIAISIRGLLRAILGG